MDQLTDITNPISPLNPFNPLSPIWIDGKASTIVAHAKEDHLIIILPLFVIICVLAFILNLQAEMRDNHAHH